MFIYIPFGEIVKVGKIQHSKMCGEVEHAKFYNGCELLAGKGDKCLPPSAIHR